MTFIDFVDKYILKYKATSIIKLYQVLSSLSFSDVMIYLRDGPFSSDTAIDNLHPHRGSH